MWTHGNAWFVLWPLYVSLKAAFAVSASERPRLAAYFLEYVEHVSAVRVALFMENAFTFLMAALHWPADPDLSPLARKRMRKAPTFSLKLEIL
jgi:hypothetical protein